MACPEPLEHAHWTERSESFGLPSRPDDGRKTEEATFLLVDDFDQDGHLDLITSVFGESEAGYPEPVSLYRGSATGFTHQADLSVEALWQPTLGDVDGDGVRDVLLAGSDFWLHNNDGTLNPRTITGLGRDYFPFTRLFAPFDLNQDGHLDLYGATTPPDGDPELIRDFIAWGDSSGHFEIDPLAHSADATGMAFTSQWIDWTGDGRPEVYVANDKGYTFGGNRLWSWDTDTPEDRAPSLGADKAHDAMGAHIADWNRDGVPDIYLSATTENVLLVSHTDGTYIDKTLVTNADPMFGLTDPILMGWGGIFADHDNDGLLDLFVTLGDWWDEPDGPRPPMELYLLQSDGATFQSVGSDIGIEAEGSFRGVLASDFNHDGILDFMVSTLFGRPLLFVSDGCTANNWLQVEAPDSSRITVKTSSTTQVGWSTTNSGFGAITPPIAHFGLGSDSVVEEIEVILPGGSKWELSESIEARRRITIRP